MCKRKFLIFMFLVMGLFALAWEIDQSQAVTQLNPAVDLSQPNFAYSPPLRKFIDSLPGLTIPALGIDGANNLGQTIPVAAPQVLAGFPNDDYYEIALVEYYEQMHSNLPPVVGTWPSQTGGTKLRGYVQENNGVMIGTPHYLGPLILATKGKPVRIKFTNRLPLTAAGGNLFLPVDTTIMGAGMGPLTAAGAPCDPSAPGAACASYTQNRATIHLHGGIPPWISDGTAHQWITPAGEITPYPKGASQQNVPDMPVPPGGSATFYWTNQQGGRLMFYHDHAYGITGLNVYGGEAAGYLLVDPAEETALAAAGVPGTVGTTPDLAHLIPLVIQDKTFVPATVAATDPLWDSTNWGGIGNLWFPHVYMPNQDPNDLSGANPLGRWDYGPWFWPIFPVASPYPPAVSHVPEAFMDTPVVNGTAYPYLNVNPEKYRLRILNASNDRMLNLQLYQADPLGFAVTDSLGNPRGTEVKMVPAVPNPLIPFPPVWLTQTPGMIPDILDSRPSGVPDPTLRGPAMIQIGTEGGILPGPVVLPNTPVGFEQNKRNIVVLNVVEKTLFMAPAERADVIVDFTNFAGKTIILYNDSPAPVPASDPRYDFYTGNPDFSATAGANYQGGAPSTLPGMGPNTRTIMQFRVSGSGGIATPDDYDPTLLGNLAAALPAAYAATQDRPVVAESAYGPAFGATFPDQYAFIYTGSSLQPIWTFIDGNGVTQKAAVPDPLTGALPPGATIALPNKTIQELFDPEGRMNATLGVELPFTGANIQTTVPLGFIDPTTEILKAGETQIWKITHNGVDTHGIHFHLVNVQVINRVGWDGAIRPPDHNELGWKDTVRMSPLEDIIVAMRAKVPTFPFKVPNSIRPLDVTMPIGSTFPSFDPITGNPITVTNSMINFGDEYTWHCHILGHEENDMMRAMAVAAPPETPSSLAAIPGPAPVVPAAPTAMAATRSPLAQTPPTVRITWRDNANNETGFRIQRATNAAFTVGLTEFTVGPSAGTGATMSYIDTSVGQRIRYWYRVQAFNARAINISWTDNSANETSWTVQRAINGGPFANLATVASTTGPAIGTPVTYTDTTVAAGTTYSYRALASNTVGGPAPYPIVTVDSLSSSPAAPIIGTAVYSVVSAATTDSAITLGQLPATPAGLTVTTPAAPAGRTSLVISWTYTSNGAPGPITFDLQRSNNGTGGWTTVANNITPITFTNTGLPINTTRYYRVRAVNADGNSPWFGVASGRTLP